MTWKAPQWLANFRGEARKCSFQDIPVERIFIPLLSACFSSPRRQGRGNHESLTVTPDMANLVMTEGNMVRRSFLQMKQRFSMLWLRQENSISVKLCSPLNMYGISPESRESYANSWYPGAACYTAKMSSSKNRGFSVLILCEFHMEV